MHCTAGCRQAGGSGKKGGLEAEVAEEIDAETRRLIGSGALDGFDFEAVETRLLHVVRDTAARAFEHQLNANHSDHAGPSLPCGCGRDARYAGRRAKTFTTVLGPVTLERAYYHCEGCERGFFPRDRAFGMVDSTLSPGAVRMTGVVAAEVSFAVASDLIGSLAGLVVDAKQVERTAEALGLEIACDERSRVESEPASAATMYLGLDGTGVPVRAAERQGRPGKQADGSSKTREVKLAVVFTADRRDPGSGHPMRDPGSVSYSAAIESAAMRDTDAEVSAFAGRVDREACRRGFHGAQRQVVLGDGAKWIWTSALHCSFVVTASSGRA